MKCACAIFSSVACLVLQYVFHIISQWQDWKKKKVIEHKMGVLISLQLVSETFLILTLSRLMTYMYVVPHR